MIITLKSLKRSLIPKINKNQYILLLFLFIFLLFQYFLHFSFFENYTDKKISNLNKPINSTVITHIYNEEYLLPFWLNHHKNIFNHGIIIDYRSTDNSINICKEICPTWEIRTTRNASFEALKVDSEVMDIENTLSGIKMVLNVTEFLFTLKPLQDYFNDNSISYSVMTTSPYSLNNYYPTNNQELFKNLLNDDIKYHNDRGTRLLHNYNNGLYEVGRHETRHSNVLVNNELQIIWLGFFPLNEFTLKRKLQIKDNIPESDRVIGAGFQHLWDKEKMSNTNLEKFNSGLPLQKINIDLFQLLMNYSSTFSN